MPSRPNLDLGEYLPYLINRVGSALVTLIFSLSHGNATVLCLQVAARWRDIG